MTFPPISPPQGVPVPVVPVGRHDVLDTPEVSPTEIKYYYSGYAGRMVCTTEYTYKSFEFRTSDDYANRPLHVGFFGTGSNWVDVYVTSFRCCRDGAQTSVSITRLTGVVTYKIEWTSTACRLYQNGSVIATITTNIPIVARTPIIEGGTETAAFIIDNVAIT